MQSTLNDQSYRMMFNAIPIAAFVVNDAFQVMDINDSAAQFCGQPFEIVHKRRGGDVLGCLHVTDAPQGCGKGPSCRVCTIRTSVSLCLEAQTVSRGIADLEFSRGLEVRKLKVLVTASPLPDPSQKLALLLVDHLPEISALKTVVPICMKCKKIKDEEYSWTEVNDYLRQRAGMFLAHGLCPDCVRKFSE